MPFFITTEKIGSELIIKNSTFSIKCSTNILRLNKIVWTKNGEEITSFNKLYTQTESKGILNFNIKNEQNLSNFNGIYKCKTVIDSDVSGFVDYYSSPISVNLRLNGKILFL